MYLLYYAAFRFLCGRYTTTSGNYYDYRLSKVALNMYGVNLHLELSKQVDKNYSVLIVHPGLVATDMTSGKGIPPAESVAGQRVSTCFSHHHHFSISLIYPSY